MEHKLFKHIACTAFILVVIVESINGAVTSCYNAVAVSDANKEDCTGANVNFCTVTFDGSGAVTARACAETCTPGSTKACCDTDDCNDAPDNSLSCIQCFDADSCSTATALNPCAIDGATHCTVTFEGGIAVAKECATSATNSATQASVAIADNSDLTATTLKTCLHCIDENSCNSTTDGTACASEAFNCFIRYDPADGLASSKGCTTDLVQDSDYELCADDDCNVFKSIQRCYVCRGEEDCAAASTPIICPSTEYYGCMTELDEEGHAISKSCSTMKDCYPSETTICCERLNCNAANTVNLTCHQCHDIASCSISTEPTACLSEDHDVCITVVQDGDVVMKTCGILDDCEQEGVSCCNHDGCNNANQMFSANFFLAFFISVFVSFNKYFN